MSWSAFYLNGMRLEYHPNGNQTIVVRLCGTKRQTTIQAITGEPELSIISQAAKISDDLRLPVRPEPQHQSYSGVSRL